MQHVTPWSGAAYPGLKVPAIGGRRFMCADDEIFYLDYAIKIIQEDQRFIARVSRDGALITHDGRSSEIWVSASCNTRDRAIWVAKNAIDTDRIR